MNAFLFIKDFYTARQLEIFLKEDIISIAQVSRVKKQIYNNLPEIKGMKNKRVDAINFMVKAKRGKILVLRVPFLLKSKIESKLTSEKMADKNLDWWLTE